jgi:ATP phosphoribosyltransferase regulatory subunit HisZ
MSWRSIAEQYYARIAELEQRGSDMSRARPDVAFDPEERAFAAIRETNQRQNARIAELEAQVAHFQTEYQDEIGRTELIENVETAKAEIAELEAQVAWSAARIAELEGAKK